MLLRAVSYRAEPLDSVVTRAVVGGTQGVMQTRTTISNKLGLHARASAKLTKLAGGFPCEVWMARGERRVNAKSIMGVMMLAAGKGAKVTLEADGADEGDCIAALSALVNDNFSVHGLAVSRGIAIGRAVLVASSRVDVAHYFVEPSQVAREIERVRQGRNAVVEELQRLQTDMPADAPHELTALLDVHLMLLQDEALTGGVKHWITERLYNAEWALTTQLEVIARQFDEMEDDYLRERK
eukprot:gene56469-77388_t